MRAEVLPASLTWVPTEPSIEWQLVGHEMPRVEVKELGSRLCGTFFSCMSLVKYLILPGT